MTTSYRASVYERYNESSLIPSPITAFDFALKKA